MKAKTIKEIEEKRQSVFTTDCIKEKRKLEQEHMLNKTMDANDFFMRLLYVFVVFTVPLILLYLWLI